MEFDQLLEERYSVRKFSNQKVEKEKIDKILEAQWEAITPVEEKVKHYEDVKRKLIEERDELD